MSEKLEEKKNLLEGVKKIVVIGSGKGGVGKSTVAVNLALALQNKNLKVGLLDADIYGPSIPLMCGIPEGERPKVVPPNQITPLVRFGISLMSMGFLIGSRDAVIWRGPMLGKVLQQFLEQVEWGDLDYLIIDLPPGTGDVQLSLSQMIPISGVVIVTTPQDVALADVRRAIEMFNKTNVPILGVVKNMATFECPHCHKVTPIFGEGGEGLDLSLLGEIPLDLETRIGGDEGKPIVVRDPQSNQTKRFQEIADRLIDKIQSEAATKAELELPSLSSS